MTISTITPLPTAPSRDDAPATFITRANAFLAALVTMGTELNTSIGQMNTDIAGVNQDAQDAADSAASAIASANFKGAWSSLTGALNIPASVSHSGSIWILLNNLADVTASEPGVSADWQDLPIIPSQTGNSGKYLTTDGSSTSWASLQGAGSADFVATGAISTGDTVGLRSDGTVEVITGSSQNAVYNPDDYKTIQTSNVQEIQGVYDSTNNKVYVKWSTNDAVYVIVGTPSGSTIAWGADNTAAASGVKYNNSFNDSGIAYDPDEDKVIVWYQGTGNDIVFKAGSVVGTTVTFGSAVQTSGVNFQEERGWGLAYDTEHDTWHFAFESSTHNRTWIQPFTVSGTVITLGTKFDMDSTFSMNMIGGSICYCPDVQKLVVAACNGSSGDTHYLWLVDYNGTTYTKDVQTNISGSGVGGTSSYNIQVLYDESTSTVLFKNSSSTHDVWCVAASVTSSSITAGSWTSVQSNLYYNRNYITLDSTSGYYWLTGRGTDNKYPLTKVSTSGTTVSSESGYYFAGTFAPSGNNALNASVVHGGSGLNYGMLSEFTLKSYSRTFREGTFTTNADSYIGISTQTVTSGQTATITVGAGTNENVSGLTAGTEYWVNYDGNLVAFSTPFAKVGTALSSTKILCNGILDAANGSLGKTFVKLASDSVAGQSAYLQTTGEVGNITYNKGSLFTNTQNTQNVYGLNYYSFLHISPKTKNVLNIYVGSSAYLYARIGTWNEADNTITWTTTATAIYSGSVQQNDRKGAAIVYSSQYDKWLVFYLQASGYLRVSTIQDISTSISVTHSTNLYSGSYNGQGNLDASWDDVNNHWLVGYSYNYQEHIAISGTYSGTTPNQSGQYYWSGLSSQSSNVGGAVQFDDERVVHYVCFQNVNNKVTVYAFDLVADNSGTLTPLPNASGHDVTGTSYMNTTYGNINMAFCKTPERLLFNVRRASPSQTEVIPVIITGKGSFDNGTQSPSVVTSSTSPYRGEIVWSENLQKAYLQSAYQYQYLTLDTTTSNGVVDDPSSTSISGLSSSYITTATYTPEIGVIGISQSDSSATDNYATQIDVAAGAFVGFWDYTATQGSKSSVTSSGQVNTAQSGLTAGSNYSNSGSGVAIDANGALTAISDTEIFVRYLS
jgi:hypothetical protein